MPLPQHQQPGLSGRHSSDGLDVGLGEGTGVMLKLTACGMMGALQAGYNAYLMLEACRRHHICQAAFGLWDREWKIKKQYTPAKASRTPGPSLMTEHCVGAYLRH